MNPKVTIITVCFNAAQTIANTIESVLGQDYPNLEYIVIDGKSSDKSLEIINQFQSQISKIISEPDQGMYDALNKGIGMASGDVIGMLNSDDFYVDEHVVSDMVTAMSSSPGYESGYADLYYVDNKNTDKVIRKWRSGVYKREKFKHGWMPPHPAFFLRKEAYEKYGGFNLEFKSAADYELMLRMLYKHKLNAAYLPRYIVKMRVGGMSNASLLNRLKANREDRRAWTVNGLKPGIHTLTFKPLRKLIQYL
ncbi:MAG: glycosyl transferase [Flavobacteriales bacterium]|nr:glycosyl transferase [Flavobacteriales bacterium]